MKKFIIVLCLFYTYLSATHIQSHEISTNKKGIALGTYISLNQAQKLANKFPHYDIFIKQTTTTKKPYFVVFAVNIPKQDISSSLINIQKKLPTAYTTSDSRIEQLSEDKNNSTIKKENIILEKQSTSEYKQNSSINTNKKGIALGTYISLNQAQRLANKFPNNDIFIKQTTTTKKPYFVVFAVNIPKQDISSSLVNIQKKLPTAYITSDSRIEQLSKDNLATIITKKKKESPKQIEIPKEFVIRKKIESTKPESIITHNKIIQDIIKKSEAKAPVKDILVNNNDKIIQDIIKKSEAKAPAKIKIKQNQDINIDLPAITIKYTKNKSDALKIANGLKYYDIYIRESKLLSKHKFMVYAVNIPNLRLEESLTQINKIYPNAFKTSKVRLNYFLKQTSKENVFIKASQNKIFNKQNIQLLTKNSNSAFLRAKNLFKQGQYHDSINILKQLSQINPNNTSINFYLGRAYYQIKDYEKASAAFERITIVDENHLRGRLELAQTYFMLGLNNEALKSFNIILQNDIPSNVKLNIEKRLKFIESKQKKHLFSGVTSLGITYDNNINNTTDVKTFYIPSFALPLTVSDKKYSDTYLTLMLNGNYLYKINDNYTLENKVNIIQQNYFDDNKRLNLPTETGIKKENKKKLELTSYSLYLSTLNKDNIFSWGADISNVNLAGTGYMETYGMGINYQKKFYNSITGFSTLKYFKKSYSELSNKYMDSKTFQLMLGQMYPSTEYGNFNMIYLYTNEKKIKTSLDSPDKQSNGIMLTNTYPISTKLVANSMIYYTREKEATSDKTFEVKKIDFMTTLSLGLSYKLTNSVKLSSNIKYIKNKSNIKIFGYDKNTIDFSIKKSF